MIALKWRNAHYEINPMVKNIQCTLTPIKWLSTSYFPEGDHLIDQLKGVRLYSQILFWFSDISDNEWTIFWRHNLKHI